MTWEEIDRRRSDSNRRITVLQTVADPFVDKDLQQDLASGLPDSFLRDLPEGLQQALEDDPELRRTASAVLISLWESTRRVSDKTSDESDCR